MILQLPTDSELEIALAQWVPSQRWFAAKDRAIQSVRIRLRQKLIDVDGFAAEHLIVEIGVDSGPAQLYQVPLGYRTHPPEEFQERALPAVAGSVVAYDGLADPAVCAIYLDGFAGTESVGALAFKSAPGTVFDSSHRARLLGAEQSNTSIVFGEQLLLKLFRHIAAGLNPDVELHRALSEVRCEYVAPLRGWVEMDIAGVHTTLAMAQDFVANAADGWSMALTSVRDLFAEGDLHAAELGSDFAGEARRLGEAVAHVHADLARQFGTERRPVAATLDGMRRRLDNAAADIPEVAGQRAAVHAVFDAAAASAPALVQRVHGDLHLGQALRTPSRWLLIDFEGEPVKTIAERRQPDSPLRDLAGMLRSFDYAGHHPMGEASPISASQSEYRAVEWSTRNGDEFCDGYAAIAGADPRDHPALLRAYVIDKAIYEAGYEARHRPTWLRLPVSAIARLVAR